MFRNFALLCALLLAAATMAAAPEELVRGPFHIIHQANDAVAAHQTLEVLEHAAHEFGPRLPVGDAPVRVIIAHTLEEFLRHARSFSQVTVSGIAKSPEGLIVVKAPRLRRLGDDYAGTLRHELVHVLLHRNTNADALPRWLNEGLAMSLANEYYWASALQIAKMFLDNRLLEYRLLDHAFLAPGNEMEFGDAYAQALSMTRYLRDKLGEDRFWAVVLGVRELSFPDALRQHGGITPQEFWQGYRRSLWLVALLGTMATGSFFTPAAFLLIAAYFRKRGSNRRTLRRWAREETEEDPRDRVFSWDDVVDGPHEWEEEPDEEDEPWRNA
jgi:hypothetical protein